MGSLFIQHPDQVALTLAPATQVSATTGITPQQPVTLGLLCISSHAFPAGQWLELHFPDYPEHQPPILGAVQQCCHEQDHYRLALTIHSRDSAMRLRMIEQQAYIRLYQSHIADTQGRNLSDNAAAQEWIARYADSFPCHIR